MAKYNAETHARNVRDAIAAGTVTDCGHLYNDHTCTCRTCAEWLAAARFFVAVAATDDVAAPLAAAITARAAAVATGTDDVAALADLMLAVAHADAELRARDPGAFITREQAECLADPDRYEEALTLVGSWGESRAISAGTCDDLAAAIAYRALTVNPYLTVNP